MRGRKTFWAGIAVLAVVGIGCGGGGSDEGGPTAPQQLTVDQLEARSQQLLNQERSANGLSTLPHNGAAAAVAREHSENMRDQGFFGHVAPSGGNLRQRLRSGGVDFNGAGENIVQVSHPSDPAGLGHNELMASVEHRSNILDDGYSSVGVGVAMQGEVVWITQIFIVD